MAKLFKIHTVNSDATDADTLISFPVLDDNGKPCVGPSGEPVVIMLHPLSQSRYRQIVHDNTEYIPARKGNPPREEPDWNAIQDEAVAFAVESWSGVIGADDKPLQCVYEAKIKLPGDTKNDIVKRAMQGEVVDATASFRPAS